MTANRQEVEARLAAAGQSISQRISALEDEVRLPGRSVRIASRGTLLGVAGAVVGGLVAWRVARSLMRRRRTRNRVEDWAADVADDAGRLIDVGLPVREAVDRAVRTRAAEAPSAADAARGGIMSVLVGYALRAGLTTLIRRFVHSVADDGNHVDRDF